MIAAIIGRLHKPNFFVLYGSLIVLAASIYGFFNAFTMDNGNTSPPRSVATSPLRGMELLHMPEMFAAGLGVLFVLLGAILDRPHVSNERTPELSAHGKIAFCVVATTALTIDISKTSTLGFVIPGMRLEYGITASTASFLAVAGLSGAACGAIAFGAMGHRIGRRNAYLIATLGFTATSMCATMSAFSGNLVMCFLMGVAVGGLAPLLITSLTEVIGGPRPGPVVVALSVVATSVGYLVAAGSSLWLEPIFGWRILWLIGGPSGLLLVLLVPWIPERKSPHVERQANLPPRPVRTFGIGMQNSYAFLIGVLTFGLTTWVPTLARAGDVPPRTASLLLTIAAIVMLPCALLAMWAYRNFGPTQVAVILAGGTAVLLLAVAGFGFGSFGSMVEVFALVAALFATNVMAAIFLPIAADLARPHSRDTTTGTVSLFNRAGGLCGPLFLAVVVSSVSEVLFTVAILSFVTASLSWWIGKKHRSQASDERRRATVR